MRLSSLHGLATMLALAAGLAEAAQPAQPVQPATVRLDYIHSGNALSEQYAVERVLIEPLPWPGDMARRFDDTNRVEVADANTATCCIRATSRPCLASGRRRKKPTG